MFYKFDDVRKEKAARPVLFFLCQNVIRLKEACLTECGKDGQVAVSLAKFLGGAAEFEFSNLSLLQTVHSIKSCWFLFFLRQARYVSLPQRPWKRIPVSQT